MLFKKGKGFVCAMTVTAFISFFTPFSCGGQILSDTTAVRLIRKGIDYTYNLQFTEAEKEASEMSRLYPAHPVNHLFKGIMIYWENYPLLPYTSACYSFEQELQKCIELCEQDKNSKFEAEICLTNLSARGMLLLFYSDNSMSRRVIGLAPGTYRLIRRSFNYTSVSPDFYFFTGLYNYYREVYPQFHPIYKPIASLFPRGNREQGLKDLDISAHKSLFLKADSYAFLCWIYLNFEKDLSGSINYIKTLSELYPANKSFSMTYIENLLKMKQYDQAEHLMQSVTVNMKNPYMLAQLDIMNGMLQEHKYRNYSLARTNYNSGINKLLAFGAYANQYLAFGFYGLSRICAAEGDQQGMRKNLRKAKDLSDNEGIVSEN